MPQNGANGAPNRGIVRDSFKLLSSGASVQVVALLLLVLIGRLYNEHTMGQLGLFLTWGGLISVAASGRFEQAIVVTPSEQEAPLLLRLALKLALLTSLCLSAIVLLVYFSPVPNPLSALLLLLPLYVLLQAGNEAFTLYTLRRKRYKRLAWAQATQGIGNNLLKVLTGLVAPTTFCLILSALLSLFFSWIVLGGKQLVRSIRTFFPRLFRISSAERHLMKRWHRFPRYGIFQILTDTLLANIVVLLLPVHFTVAEVGIFTMAVMLCARPLNVLNRAVGSVYFERMSRSVQLKQPLRALIRRLLLAVFLIGLPAAALLWPLMDGLVSLVVGDKWLLSALVIRLMLPSKVPNFAVAILNVLPDIFGKQRAHMTAELIMLVARTVVILSAFQTDSFKTFLIIFFAYQVVEQIGYLLFLVHFAVRYDRSLARR